MPKPPILSTKASNAVLILITLGIVFAAFLPTLKNDFILWDDDVHLYENITVQSLDAEHIRDIFTGTVNDLYIPLTILSFAVEYHYFGYDPFICHLNNLLLHLGVVALIFWFGLQLGLAAPASGLAALVFGVHPMHVESVAWVTERKDVLYAFFYMGALVSYCRYLEFSKTAHASQGQKFPGYLILTMVLGVVSMLAKPMALSLPLILFLLDWFYGRKFSRSSVIEKIPLIIAIAAITWLSYASHVRVPGKNIVEIPLIWAWTFTFYLRQFLFPLNLMPLYRLPQPIAFTYFEYFLSAAVLCLVILSIVRLRQYRWFIFAVAFYFFSIFFLLRFDEAKDVNIVADRFMYLPSLGFCLLAGYGVQQVWHRPLPKAAMGVLSIVLFILATFFLKTNEQCRIWKNSVSLWRHQLDIYPKEVIALNNLAIAIQEEGKFKAAEETYKTIVKMRSEGFSGGLAETALKDQAYVEEVIRFYQKAVEADPGFVEARYNLGKLYDDLGDLPKAVEHYRNALMIDNRFKDAHISLGDVYRRAGDAPGAVFAYAQAIKFNPGNEDVLFNVVSVFNEAIKKDPKNKLYVQARGIVLDDYTRWINGQPPRATAFFNLGYLYAEMGDLTRAVSAYQMALDISPKHGKALYNLGNIYKEQGRLVDALTLYKKVSEVDPRNSDAYLNMGSIYLKRGNRREAKESFQKAVKVDPENAKAYFNLGVLEESAGNLQKAIDLYRESIAKDPNNRVAYYNLGNSYAKLMQNTEAINSYLNAVKVDTNYMDAWVNLSILSFKEEDYANAVKYCDEAILLGYKAPQEYLNALAPYRL